MNFLESIGFRLCYRFRYGGCIRLLFLGSQGCQEGYWSFWKSEVANKYDNMIIGRAEQEIYVVHNCLSCLMSTDFACNMVEIDMRVPMCFLERWAFILCNYIIQYSISFYIYEYIYDTCVYLSYETCRALHGIFSFPRESVELFPQFFVIRLHTSRSRPGICSTYWFKGGLVGRFPQKCSLIPGLINVILLMEQIRLTSWYGKYPIIYRILYIQPVVVIWDFWSI